MKKSIAPLLFGLALILAGLGYLGTAFLGWNFDLFFDGWWTLFIIIPTFAAIVMHGPSVGNVTGCLVGVLLLLRAQDIIKEWNHFGICIVALVIIAIGVSLIFGFFGKGRQSTYTYQGPPPSYGQPSSGQANQYSPPPNQPGYTNQAGQGDQAGQSEYTGQTPPPPPPGGRYWSEDTSDFPNFTGILSGSTAKCTSQNFRGARLSAIMGGVDLDLRDVVIRENITIYATSIMGGIDIYAPRNVRIAIQKTDILGETECKAYTLGADSGAPVCTFVCTCIMAGIDIK